MASLGTGRLGILAGSFNPPTRAHMALARSAFAEVDEVLFVVPRVFPHKEYQNASLEDRVHMLQLCAAGEPRFSIAVSEGGLFLEIASEVRAHYPASDLYFLCGRDAAERIVNWDYGRPGAVEGMLEAFSLLVAQREGHYEAPESIRHRVKGLPIEGFDEFSSTLVRDRAANWRDLVPEEIHEEVERIYFDRDRHT